MSTTMLARLALIGTLSAVSAGAWALDTPKGSSKDPRIRNTQYDPADVILVNTAPGVVTHIVLADDEQFVTHAFGDAAAYDFQQVGKHLVLKPLARKADTNLIVITDKRDYAFKLHYLDEPDGKAFYRLNLNYPDIDRARATALNQQTQIAQALDRTGLAINWQTYTMAGDKSLAPINAWDDGAQTWLRFAPGQDLPAVYFVDADGNEVIVNRHMADPQTIVLHRIAAKWHLRLGDQVLAIHNEGAHQTRSLSTGTVSPDVQRVIRQEVEQ